MKTTIEISDPLLAQVRRVTREEGITLRALVEEGLRRVLKERRPGRFTLRRASFGGSGLQPDVREGSWERVRDLIYKGRGA
jgi:Arc/MetJ family transcription regulator